MAQVNRSAPDFNRPGKAVGSIESERNFHRQGGSPAVLCDKGESARATDGAGELTISPGQAVRANPVVASSTKNKTLEVSQIERSGNARPPIIIVDMVRTKI